MTSYTQVLSLLIALALTGQASNHRTWQDRIAIEKIKESNKNSAKLVREQRNLNNQIRQQNEYNKHYQQRTDLYNRYRR